jgi:hypothetical protein
VDHEGEGNFGTNDFSINITVTPRENGKIAADTSLEYGALLQKETSDRHLTIIVYDDGEDASDCSETGPMVKFRLGTHKQENLGNSNCVKDDRIVWVKDQPISFEFRREGNSLLTFVGGELVGTFTNSAVGAYDVTSSAPLRLGGNWEDSDKHNVNADLSNIVLCDLSGTSLTILFDGCGVLYKTSLVYSTLAAEFLEEISGVRFGKQGGMEGFFSSGNCNSALDALNAFIRARSNPADNLRFKCTNNFLIALPDGGMATEGGGTVACLAIGALFNDGYNLYIYDGKASF